ncbi:mental retardation GTPase activating protein [Perilla frutescens var. hirtella]|uniref:Mental retardation GTPase activating protein n=1 Tax=Perilla frutescens var. hirtella TaxID=608512 RepID=A0AAD4INU8_PERFH|nr:mental retardation GTPase activating protein [Perilla frutescens var. hirtella]
MEQSNLKEWGLKAPISRENSKLRRFSSSNFKSFREDHSCTTTISTSTLSSPGYTIKEEIDPSTYSFTAALKEKEKKCTTRDVGIQSMPPPPPPPPDLSSSSSSPIPTTPSIGERRRKLLSVGESEDSSSSLSTGKEKPEAPQLKVAVDKVM